MDQKNQSKPAGGGRTKSKQLSDADVLGLDLAGSHREGHTGPDLLTDEQILQFKKMFDGFDSDKTGSIETSQLHTIMVTLGQDTTNAEVMDLVNVIDLDGNGTIDFPDFLTMILVFEFSFGLGVDDDDMFKEFEYAFHTFDGDGSGNITIRDFRAICEGLSGSIQLDPEEIEELILEADIDGDGLVDYEALVPLLLGKDTMKLSAARVKRKKDLEAKAAVVAERKHQEELTRQKMMKKGQGAIQAAEAARLALAQEQSAHEKTLARMAMMEDMLAAAGIELDDEEHRGGHTDAAPVVV